MGLILALVPDMHKMSLKYQIVRKLLKTTRVMSIRLTANLKKLPLAQNGTIWLSIKIITETYQ